MKYLYFLIGLIIVSVIGVLSFSDKQKDDDMGQNNTPDTRPRGVRNNNPFNIIKTGILWLGKKLISSDSEYEQFHSMEHGIRAGLKNLKNGYFSKNITTANEIVEKYSPVAESKFHYKEFLAATVLGTNQINESLRGKELETAAAILRYENGIDVVEWDALVALNKKYKVFGYA